MPFASVAIAKVCAKETFYTIGLDNFWTPGLLLFGIRGISDGFVCTDWASLLRQIRFVGIPLDLIKINMDISLEERLTAMLQETTFRCLC